MPVVLPLELIFDDVKAQFVTDSTAAVVLFGKREVAKSTNQHADRAARVVFVPGVDGKMGSYTGAVRAGRNPRPLKTLLETATVYVWAVDKTDLTNDRKQYTACMLLHDAVVRAIELSVRSVAHANVAVKLSDLQEVAANTERSFGFELRFTLEVQHMIPDEALTQVEVSGDFAVELDDTADTPNEIMSGA